MTISTTTSRVSYGGNSVTKIFAVPFRFLRNGDLVVELVDAAGAVTTHVLNTDYTVTGADLDAGGTVTMITPPASGERLVIRRVVEATQETDYISGDPFPAESHERALDRLTMLVQQNQEALTRTLQLPPTSDADASAINVEAVEVVAGIAADVSAVAGISADVSTVAAIDADVTTVAGIATDIEAVSAALGVSAFAKTLIDDADAAAARATLGAASIGTAETITGAKTFTQPIVGSVTGNAGTATSAESVANGVYTVGAQTLAGLKTFSGGHLSTSASQPIGYASGAGGAYTQLTSKSTDVAIDRPCGRITTHNAALAAGVGVTFTVTSSLVKQGTIVLLQGIDPNYTIVPYSSFDGQFFIMVRNVSVASLSNAVTIRYAMFDSV